MKARAEKNLWTAWTRIQEGDYSSDDLARMLLRASGSYKEAKKALTRADNDPRVRASMRPAPGLRPIASGVRFTSDDMQFLAARQVQLQHRAAKKPCTDFTAIKKSAGSHWRTLWRKYQRRKPKQTLKQIALLYAHFISDKPGPVF